MTAGGGDARETWDALADGNAYPPPDTLISVMRDLTATMEKLREALAFTEAEAVLCDDAESMVMNADVRGDADEQAAAGYRALAAKIRARVHP